MQDITEVLNFLPFWEIMFNEYEYVFLLLLFYLVIFLEVCYN